MTRFKTTVAIIGYKIMMKIRVQSLRRELSKVKVQQIVI